MDLIDIYRNLHLKEAKYMFFSNAHGKFLKIDHMVGHKKKPQQIQENWNCQVFSQITMAWLETNLKEKTKNIQVYEAWITCF